MFGKTKRGRDLFRPYELAAIDALRDVLSASAVDLFDRQIASKELVQRLHDDAEVNTYPKRRGPQQHDAAIAFPNRSPDLRLATVDLEGPRGKGKVVFHAVSGHVFQLTFRPKPGSLGPRHEIVATRTTLHEDPMAPDDRATTRDYLDRLDPGIRAELDQAWASPDRPMGVVAREDLYTIDLDDGPCLMLAQLPDTTFVVARLDAQDAGLRRYEPDGELIGEFEHLSDALMSPAWR